MRVHIVCPDHDEDKILGRLARTLSDGTGWSISGGPDPDATLNYFFPYLVYSQTYPNFTGLSAGYFTHREGPGWPQKRAWWDHADRDLDLRLTSDRQNLSILREPSGLVPYLPVDREFFKPEPVTKPDLPVLGFAGFVDPRSGRKGEALARKLVDSFPGVRFKAIGRGWPVPTSLVPWSEVPAFYQSLDAYVSTSTNEGAQVTVLEALACSTPVVVPKGTGIMDDLPDMPGIHRYEKGDFDALVKAVEDVLAADWDAGDLRQVTEPYTPERWAEDHIAAFERLLYPRAKTLKPLEGNRGMYCVAFGEPSRECVVTCIESFKAHNPGVPVALASTEPLGPEDIFIPREDLDIGGRQAKLAVYRETDWEYTLYLDADTECVESVEFVYGLLADGWEAVICRDMDKYHVARMMKRPDNQEEYEYTMDTIGTGEVMQYNGGVFAFRRCENVERFFNLWNAEWRRYGARDQGALLRALHRNPVRLFVLGNEWNASDRYPPPRGKVAVWHHNITARRWSGLIDGRIDSDEAWEAVRTWERKR